MNSFILFSVFAGLVYLIKTSPVVRYYLKFSAYYGIVMVGSLFLVPVFIFKPFSVHNFVTASHCFRWITHLIGVKWIVENCEYLESDEPCIIVSNHQSSLDVLGLFQIWPQMGKCTAIARNAVFWVWPMGFAAWLAGLIFIPRAKSKADRAKAVINDVVDQLAPTQTKLWVFPEGTRRDTGKIHEFKKGAFHAAILAQLPIQPVVFSRYYFIDSVNKRFNTGVVIIHALKPISTKGLTLEDLVSVRELVHIQMREAFKDINLDLYNKSNCSDDRIQS